jgi:hypothetical protein
MKNNTVIRILGALLLATASGRAQDELQQHRPIIVKVLNFTNQTQAIPQTTVFTPSQDGFFRANVYLEAILGSTGLSSVCPYLSFTDDPGVATYPGEGSGGVAISCLDGGVPLGVASQWLFRAKANSPIMFDAAIYPGPIVQPFAYSVYIVIGRLS